MNDPVGVDRPIGSFGRMTAAPSIYGTPATGPGSIDKSATVRPSFFRIPADVALRQRRYTPSIPVKQANSRDVRSDTLLSWLNSPKSVV